MSEHATAPAETPSDVLDDLGTVHLYPRDLRYRKSGATSPRVGDIARCGWVKQLPPRPGGYPAGSENCLMCIRLDELNAA